MFSLLETLFRLTIIFSVCNSLDMDINWLQLAIVANIYWEIINIKNKLK